MLQTIDDSTCELFFDDGEYGKTAGSVVFKFHEPVKVGDYIVYLDDTDIYHCRREVFEERNIM